MNLLNSTTCMCLEKAALALAGSKPVVWPLAIMRTHRAGGIEFR